MYCTYTLSVPHQALFQKPQQKFPRRVHIPFSLVRLYFVSSFSYLYLQPFSSLMSLFFDHVSLVCCSVQ